MRVEVIEMSAVEDHSIEHLHSPIQCLLNINSREENQGLHSTQAKKSCAAFPATIGQHQGTTESLMGKAFHY